MLLLPATAFYDTTSGGHQQTRHVEILHIVTLTSFYLSATETLCSQQVKVQKYTKVVTLSEFQTLILLLKKEQHSTPL